MFRRMRFSLFSKIMLWFFLNLLLLGAILLFIFNLDFRFAPQSRFFGETANRIQAVSRLISSETADATRAERDAVLQKYSEVYNVEFFVFDAAGNQIAGKEKQLPGEVLDALKRLAATQSSFSFRRQMNFNDSRDSSHRSWRQPPPPLGRQSLLFEKTSDPPLYWFGSRIFIFEKNQAEPQTAILLTASDSVSGHGLFFDPVPWLVVATVIFFVSTLFWLPFVRSITKNVALMTQATEQIAEERFDVRVGEKRTDELGRLGRAINHLAARLSGFVHGQKRFLGDISHELNSPLARMQFALGILENRATEAERPLVEDVKEEVELMSKLVSELLVFSKAGIKTPQIQLERVRLRLLVERVVEREAAANSVIEIKIDEKLEALAQPELFSRAVANIVRNAVRYAGDAGTIEITGEPESNGQVKIVIADRGAGVPDDALEKLFDPFYRIETDRARASGGTGLGLAIVKTCIEACGGKVSAANRLPSGLAVSILLGS